QSHFPEPEPEQDGGDPRRSAQPRPGSDGFSRLSPETSFASGRLRVGRGPRKPLGSAPGGQQMVPESDLADALPIFPDNASAAAESDQDVGPLVYAESGVRDRLRRGHRLSLWLGRVSLSGVRVFLFHWAASGGSALDSGALHVRF